MHAPINGSTVNPKARLYKRFTVKEELESNNTEEPESNNNVIEFENNYYCTHFSFRFVDTTDRQEGEYDPIDGLHTPNGYMTIKYNGKYKAKPDSPYEPHGGDLLEIDGELWIIEEPIQKVRIKSLRNFATIYLSLRKVL